MNVYNNINEPCRYMKEEGRFQPGSGYTTQVLEHQL